MPNVDCFIELSPADAASLGLHPTMPFEIQPRCPLQKLQQNVLEQLGFRVMSIVVQRHGRIVGEFDCPECFLIEDCRISRGDHIFLNGSSVDPARGRASIKDAVSLDVEMQWRVGPNAKIDPPHNQHVKCQARLDSSIQQVIELFRRGCDFVPNTVQVFAVLADGSEALLNTTRTVRQCGLQDGAKLIARGEWFPASWLDLEHLENVGIKVSAECCVCLEPKLCQRLFDCGHMNVCDSCPWTRSSCPVCFRAE